MECKEYVEFTVDSPHGDYKAGRFGIIVGFCRGGDDVRTEDLCAASARANRR